MKSRLTLLNLLFKRTLLQGAVALLAGSAGCAGSGMTGAREGAAQRWNMARAQVKTQLAEDQLSAGNLRQAETEIRKASSLAPNDARVALVEARVAVAAGDEARARRVLSSTALHDRDLAEAEYLLGVLDQQRLRWSEALAHYAAAREIVPDDPSYFAALSQVLLQLGRAGDALDIARESEDSLGWTETWHATVAECHEQLGDWNSAASHWRHVLGPSDDPGFRERLAIALLSAGRWTEAEPLLQAMAADSGSTPSTALQLAIVDCLIGQREFEKARAALVQVLKMQPRLVGGLVRMARVHAERDELGRALHYAQRGLNIDPRSVEALEWCAALQYRLGNHDQAQALCRRLREVTPDRPHPVADMILAAGRPAATDALPSIAADGMAPATP